MLNYPAAGFYMCRNGSKNPVTAPLENTEEKFCGTTI